MHVNLVFRQDGLECKREMYFMVFLAMYLVEYAYVSCQILCFYIKSGFSYEVLYLHVCGQN